MHDSSDDHQIDSTDARHPKRTKTTHFSSVEQLSDNGIQVPEDEGPACQACRKKKIKCSRQHPCTYCIQCNTDCIYSTTRVKPGLKPGAVGNLNQRVDSLESMFLGQSVLWQQVWSKFSELERQIPSSSVPKTSRNEINGTLPGGLEECTQQFKQALSGASTSVPTSKVSNTEGFPKSPPSTSIRTIPDLPANHVLQELVDLYFKIIHPWIPILHVRRFKDRLTLEGERKSIEVILYAIVSLMIRFSRHEELDDPEIRRHYIERSREKVILRSVESFSVENLQALIIISFDTIGNGRGPSSWSMVGSITRTVEQLQLNIEDEDREQRSRTSSVAFLLHRMIFLTPPTVWIVKEEYRRAYWAVFLMDRFCSIATGWDLSIPSASIRRRLPCERVLWEEGQPLEIPAPFFSTVEKRLHGLGNPDSPSPGDPLMSSADAKDPTSIGGFAYRIEATETLSLVTLFLLKNPVDVSNPQRVQIWMMRFKELDLRLVQWKIYLPDKWREASVFTEKGIMDQNLSLAHVLHNTAVILLHQGIAFPCSQWRNSPIRLPSKSSVETCLAAATEISNLAEQFLLYSLPTAVVAPEMAICLFISGRMLLAHGFYHNMEPSHEFQKLMKSLTEIGRRWNGHFSTGNNLASKLADRLARAHELGYPAAREIQQSLDLRHTVYWEKQHEEIAGELDGMPSAFSTPSQTQRDPGTSQGTSESRGGDRRAALSLGDLDAVATQIPTGPDISLAFSGRGFTPQIDWGHGLPFGQMTPSSSQFDKCSDALTGSFPQQQGYGGTNAEKYRDSSMQNFDDLSSFFESTYLPTQRISTLIESDDIIGNN